MPSPLQPPRLRPGDHVRIVNPSLALPSTGMLERAVSRLEARGLRVSLGRHVHARWLAPGALSADALAGTDEQRAADLNEAFGDPAVRLVLAAWGGGGAVRLLENGLVDWRALRADPKILCGFSDFGHLQLAAYRQLHLVSLDGPTALQWAAPSDEPMIHLAWATMTEALAPGALPGTDQWYASQVPPQRVSPAPRPRPGGHTWLRPGSARGTAVAAMPASLLRLHRLGLAPSLAGAIWFVDPYRSTATELSAVLASLADYKAFDDVAGLVLARPWPGPPGAGAAVEALFTALADGLRPRIPVVSNIDVGHTWPRWTIAIGIAAEMDSASGGIRLLTPAVH